MLRRIAAFGCLFSCTLCILWIVVIAAERASPPALAQGPDQAPRPAVDPAAQRVEELERNNVESKLADESVRSALQWLAKQQQADGSWSLAGPFRDGIAPAEPAAATAMALLAFQGAGNTHKSGEHQKAVLKGKDYLLARQLDDGAWRTESNHHRMFTMGLCTIALCELYAATEDKTLRLPAEKAASFCVKSQSKLGGWRYNPADDDADVAVTGWVTMGLQSAKLARLDVPDRTFQKIGKFLDEAKAFSVGYGYLPKTDEGTKAMTAEALTIRQWLGWSPDDKRLQSGIGYLMLPEHAPRWADWDDQTARGRDVYFWFFATQAIHQYGGKDWGDWNKAIRKTLCANQVKTGAEKGSWDMSGDKWGRFGGRLYVTCLSTCILEVGYEQLHVYKVKR